MEKNHNSSIYTSDKIPDFAKSSAIVLLLTSHIQSEFFCCNCIIIFSIKYVYPRLVLMVAELR